jgi:hypothetical protein
MTPTEIRDHLISFGILGFNFSTKNELISNAFKYYGDRFTQDQILDKCEKIWNKHLKNRENQ